MTSRAGLAGTAADSGQPAPALQEMIEQLMAVARVSALEEMASGIAHELNQPLGAIATFAQAAERMLNRPAPMVAEALEVMHLISKEALGAGEGIRRMRQIFNRDAFVRLPHAMDAVISELRPVLDLLAIRAEGVLTVTIGNDLPQVDIDKLRIQHVLFTLVQNGFEACDGRTAAQPEAALNNPSIVHISLSGDRYGVEVQVTDNGTGVAPQHRDQLFRPFFTTKAQGNGLGLASTRAIVEAHEGTIGFDASRQHGSQFWFRLPATNGHEHDG